MWSNDKAIDKAYREVHVKMFYLPLTHLPLTQSTFHSIALRTASISAPSIPEPLKGQIRLWVTVMAWDLPHKIHTWSLSLPLNHLTVSTLVNWQRWKDKTVTPLTTLNDIKSSTFYSCVHGQG